MKNLQELFEHQLKDLYSAESQLIKALPTMVENACDKKLKEAFERHLKETEEHRIRLKDACEKLDIKPGGEKCNAMEGLIKEAEGFIKEAGNDEVMDAGLIAEAQRVEHYEIAGYGTAVRYANQLGHKEIARMLQKSLDEEYSSNETLDKLAQLRLNKKAMA